MSISQKKKIWFEGIRNFEMTFQFINDKIFSYNLMVPMSRQLFPFDYEKEINKITGGRDPILGNAFLVIALRFCRSRNRICE
jgi:hypothetical protein